MPNNKDKDRFESVRHDIERVMSQIEVIPVTDQLSREHAVTLRSDIGRSRNEKDALIKPFVQIQNDAHKKAVSKSKSLLEPMTDFDVKQKREIDRFDLNAYVGQIEFIAGLKNKHVQEVYSELASAGNVESALEVIDHRAFGLKATVPKGSRLSHTFTVNDLKRVRPEFMMTVLDPKKVQDIVNEFGKDAESMVGGISVEPKLSHTNYTKPGGTC